MRVSYDWLKTMIDIPEDPKTLSDEYIRTGTEVEAIDTVGESFDHVVTAKVLTKTPHPAADRLRRAELRGRRPHRHSHDWRRASR